MVGKKGEKGDKERLSKWAFEFGQTWVQNMALPLPGFVANIMDKLLTCLPFWSSFACYKMGQWNLCSVVVSIMWDNT